MSGDVNLRHTAFILFDAYDGMIPYETCLSGVKKNIYMYINFMNFILTENMKILLFIHIYYHNS